MIMKRVISVLTSSAILASMTSVLSGCSMKEFFTNEPNKPAESESEGSGAITNAEWLAMVNDAFGMQVDENAEDGELDAAKEWGIIGENEVIDKNAPVDDKFITTTLMRAAGYADADTPDAEVINAAVQHGVISDPNASLSDPSQALESLVAAQESWSHQTFEEHLDIGLAENVVDYTTNISVKDIEIKDNNVTIPSLYAESLDKDEVYILPKEASDGKGGAYKVVSVVDHGDGTSTVKSVPASLGEVYEHVKVSGQFGVDTNSVQSMGNDVDVSFGAPEVQGVAFKMDDEGGIVPLGYAPAPEPEIQQLGSVNVGDVVNFKVDLGDGYSVTTSLKDVALNADIDWSYKLFHGLDVKRIYMAVDYTTEITFETKEFSLDEEKFSIEKALSKKFLSKPSLEVGKMAVYICPGLSVNLRVKLSLEASGQLKVTVTTENTKGFEMKGSSFRAINETHTSQDLVITGEVGAFITLTLALSLDYLVGEVDLVNIDLKVGPVLAAELKIHNEEGDENDLLCIDLSGYLKIEVKLYFLKDLMDLLDLDASVTLVDLDKDSSPISWKMHLENFKRTPGDVCTLDEKPTEAATVEPTIPTGIFALTKSYLSLDVGASAKIEVKSLPSGYSAGDIVWSSSDTSKATVDSNGNVTAKSAGSVSITAKTKDGKYSISCAVNAKAPIVLTGNRAAADAPQLVAA